MSCRARRDTSQRRASVQRGIDVRGQQRLECYMLAVEQPIYPFELRCGAGHPRQPNIWVFQRALREQPHPSRPTCVAQRSLGKLFLHARTRENNRRLHALPKGSARASNVKRCDESIVVTDPQSVARYLAKNGELTCVPPPSPNRGPPFCKSSVLRQNAGADGQ
jgi:hypothetical protein